MLGVAVWVALLDAGVDPVITGLAVGMINAAYPPARADLEQVTELARSFREQPSPQLARSAQLGVAAAISPNERLQYRLHPWTSFAIVPLFALANTGIHVDGELLRDAVDSPITLGIFFGYVVGKPLGIFLGSRLVALLWPGRLPMALSWPVRTGGAVVAGIGFTISLLIAHLAFEGPQLEQAKVGVLASAGVAALGAWLVFSAVRRLPAEVRARQLARTSEDLVDLSDEVDPARDHIRGPVDAPVTLVEYGDYECPYCSVAEVAIREVLADFGDDIRYVWRHLPLNDVHRSAQMAAEAADVLHQRPPSPGRLRRRHARERDRRRPQARAACAGVELAVPRPTGPPRPATCIGDRATGTGSSCMERFFEETLERALDPTQPPPDNRERSSPATPRRRPATASSSSSTDEFPDGRR